MRRACPAVLVLLLACPALTRPAPAQHGGHEAKQETKQDARKDAKAAAGQAVPVIGCTSLANLRALERETGTDAAAALAVIRRPGSDLGCSEIDPAHVAAVADHVVLGGQAYECLSLQGTVVCHWAPAGRLAPAAPVAKPRSAEKPKR